MDESSLIQRVQEGDRAAFAEVMDLHVRRLRAFIALNAPAAHLIDEIAHEAFVFAYNHVHEFQRGTSFFAWLKSIAWNLLRAEVQRFSREQANQMKYAEQRLFEVVPAKPVEKATRELEGLENCLDRVPPKLKDLLKMRYALAYSTREIAERFDQSAAWVRTTLFRVRRQLKDCVESRLSAEKS